MDQYAEARKRTQDAITRAAAEGREVVICSAVVAQEGFAFRGHRHACALASIVRHGKKRDPNMSAVFTEGFITSRNRYVGRKEGYALQVAAGIPSALEGTDHADGAYLHRELYSEDLY